MEGYGNDNPGAKSQGMKQLMAGGGVALIGGTLVPPAFSTFRIMPKTNTTRRAPLGNGRARERRD
ncbi:hypothetical protein IB211_03275 [Intestinimonas butyriciproducens]|uniref:Uncharacterized protein n=1 Tax=Intestinimonas butyriciproducens TaxID=1297617 RepID=A0A0S2W8G2_9FIRM|nr:hypothetical protein IB211_03275 [Intestinimonas butyriciproducens]